MKNESSFPTNINYFKCFTEEPPNQGLYNDLYKIGEEKFYNWFSKNAKSFDIRNDEKIKPPKDILEKLTKEKIYMPAATQCHYNSQMACLLHDKLEFYTGFLIRNNDEEPITHRNCLKF